MMYARADSLAFPEIVRDLVGSVGFFFLLVVVALIVYFDDIQLVAQTAQEIPTIYNVRIAGIKVIDALSIGLVLLLLIYLVLKSNLETSAAHRWLFIISLVYLYAGVVGYIYSFFYHYDYLVWIQDVQQTVYLLGFFLVTFYFVNTARRWKIFSISFIGLLAAKNGLILYHSALGIGKTIGDWAIRSSQNAEFAFFPMMFFVLLLLLLRSKSLAHRIGYLSLISIYLANSLLGIYRTVWVMLIFGLVYLLAQLESRKRWQLTFSIVAILAIVLYYVSLMYPRFLKLAWTFKFASIFDWSVHGDRSNSTRLLEVTNVLDRVFSQSAFLQGMGLGAWWDDSARRLLPDFGSGFTYKTRFTTTHMWYLTQILKLGFIGTCVYWWSMYKIVHSVAKYIRTMSWEQWEKSMMLGLNVGLIAAFLSSADFVRLYQVIGINLGMTASYMSLYPRVEQSQT
jgi:hypothetical protein